MRKRSTASYLTICGFLILASVTVGYAQFKRDMIHNLDAMLRFSSTSDITNYFKQANVPITVVELHRFDSANFIFAAYPYSGSDTIDVYNFVKFGPVWRVQMVYFALAPKNRAFEVVEKEQSIAIMDGSKLLVSISPMQTH
jgi:hypothetical protein